MVLRANAFGIETEEIFGNDVERVFETSSEAVKYVREKKRPFWLVCDTYRQRDHSKSDDLCYRSKEEEPEWKKKDPIILLDGKIEFDIRKAIEMECENRVCRCVDMAIASDFPNVEN